MHQHYNKRGNGTQERYEASIKFAAEYAKVRRLDPSACELIPLEVQQFTGLAGFVFLNHDEEGKPRRDLSNTRLNSKDKHGRFRMPPGVGNVAYAPTPDSWANCVAHP